MHGEFMRIIALATMESTANSGQGHNDNPREVDVG